jgi:hypothetical protein
MRARDLFSTTRLAVGVAVVLAAAVAAAPASPDRGRREIEPDGLLETIVAPGLPQETWPNTDVALFDADADGDLDAIVAGRTPTHFARYLENDGNGYFSVVSNGLSTIYDVLNEHTSGLSIAVGDLDGDDDPDVIIGAGGQFYGGGYPFEAGLNQVFLNENGIFENVTEQTPWGIQWLYTDTESIALGDLDNDGDLDLLTGNDTEQYDPPTNRVWENTAPHPTFVEAQTMPAAPTEPGQTKAVVMSDFNGDGFLDVFEGNSTHGCSDDGLPGGQSRIYLNDGDGELIEAPSWLAEGMDGAVSAVSGDVDGDGDNDLLVARGEHLPVCEGGVYLFLNEKSGFANAGAITGSEVDDPSVVKLGDPDSDGDLDLFVGQGYYRRNFIYRNVRGAFRPSPIALPAHEDSTKGAALGDVDGDGDLDILVANHGQNRLYINDGSGFFWCPWDLDGDAVVDHHDLLELVHNLGPCDEPGNCPMDLNGDGVVNGRDVAELARHFGLCP